MEEEIKKGSKAPVCWIWKLTVEVVALIPATVPLSLKMPGVKAPVLLPVKAKPGVKEPAPLPPLVTANVPVQLGTKVRVLAVLVLMPMTMLVSEVVATWTPGPVKEDMEVKAEVR